MYEETTITLLLVEDEPLIRHGLRMWLDQVLDVTVVGEASNGAEAVLLAQALRPDVVLVDLSIPPMDGISTTTALRRAVPQSAVVLLSLQDDTATRARAQAAGSVAFVGKQEGVRALLAAIRKAGSLKRQSLTPHARRLQCMSQTAFLLLQLSGKAGLTRK